jgi:beta-aspartyl-dipeptidase (metallo-type)
MLHRIIDEFEVEPAHIHAAHVNRNEELMDDAIALARKGAFVCVDTTDDDTGRWLRHYRDGDGPWSQLFVASDAHTADATPGQLRDALTASVRETGLALETVLPVFTRNTARALKLDTKGCLEAGADADVVLLDADTLAVTDVFARGQQVVEGGGVIHGEPASNDPPSPY